MIRRALWPLFFILVLAGALLRWRMPGLMFQARNAAAWASLTALGLVGLRLAYMAMDARRGRLPWTRLLLPAVLLVEGLGLALQGGQAPAFWRNLKLLTAAGLEGALVVFLILRLVRVAPEHGVLPEDH
ncbi:MAG TPA: hypothetical protein VJ570_11345, partial [Holophagaceae bacterium]|nr:hypothetical protein [Holophagaceae bacterium]